MKISEIKSNPNNPRLIKEEKFRKLVKSIKDFPEMMELRPIVIDENNVIQGGNMRYQALLDLKYKEIPDSWVKQGKDLTEDQWKQFVIKDNVGFGEWEWEKLANEWDENKLDEWGLDIPNKGIEEEYSSKIESPIYKITEEKPDIQQLVNLDKYNELMDKINDSNLTDEERLFLQLSATRHIVFDYSKIAEFYAHSESEMQTFIEDSAMVIIDFKKAIENGFVKLHKELNELSDIDA